MLDPKEKPPLKIADKLDLRLNDGERLRIENLSLRMNLADREADAIKAPLRIKQLLVQRAAAERIGIDVDAYDVQITPDAGAFVRKEPPNGQG